MSIATVCRGLSAALVLLLAPAASAQVASPGTTELYSTTYTLTGIFNESSQDLVLFTVPAGRWYRVTDVMVTNISQFDFCDFRFLNKTAEFRVPPSSTFTNSFLTGLVYPAGSQVIMRNSPALGGLIPCGRVTISGYTARKP